MEDPSKTTDTASFSDTRVAYPHHRHSVPDIPEDVEHDDELMLHFNDLNWDFRANSSTRSIYLDDVQPNLRSVIAPHMDTVTEVTMDSEFQMSPWHIHNSNADVSPKGEHLEWVCFPLHLASHI